MQRIRVRRAASARSAPMPLNPALLALGRDWRRKLDEAREVSEKPMLEPWQEYSRRRAHDPLREGHARATAARGWP